MIFSLLGYPGGSGAASLDETLELKYHTFPFCTLEILTGGFLKPGHVADILTTGGEDVGLVGVEAVGNSVGVGWGFGFS